MVILLITGVGIYSGKKVKSASDFAVGGRKAGAGIVAGTIIGTLVGGSSTVGTAQLAFSFGLSAWWFTLGGGIACLVLAIGFAKPFYDSRISTIPQVFSREYGQTASTVSAVLMSIGSLFSIIAQLLAGMALISSVSKFGGFPATLCIIALMLCYVIFGGVWGAGLVGIAKTILLYGTVLVCGFLAVSLAGGISTFTTALPHAKYFNLIARGASTDIGAGLSLVLGVITTQSYIQAVISAKSLKASKAGVLISAFLIPIIGIAGILVGMYMKLNNPTLSPAKALPTFIMLHVPALPAGAIMATLLVAVVGTGAGLALGMSSMICNDIYKVYFNKNASDQTTLNASRIIIVGILLGASLFTLGNMGSLILGWSFMSMGLRGAVAFAPLCCALFLPGRINKKFALYAFIAGPLFVLIGNFILPKSIDPLFLGVGVAILFMLVGYFVNWRKPTLQEKKSVKTS